MAGNEKNVSFYEALKMLAEEKGIEPELLIEKIETAVGIAVKKEYPRCENVKYTINERTGALEVALLKEVVEELEDDANQILLEEAKKYSRRYKRGET